jgi:hypothetical protein
MRLNTTVELPIAMSPASPDGLLGSQRKMTLTFGDPHGNRRITVLQPGPPDHGAE